MGANFQELIGIVRYQPINKLFIYARAIYYYQGLDSSGKNFGANIFRDYSVRPSENGFTLGSGQKADCLNLIFNLSYELKHNLYLDGGFQTRTYKTGKINEKSTMINFGFRLNINRREYDF